MKIKRYTGTNTREVLTRIRNDLGADAVILSNREIVGGVELMAAVDFDTSRFPSDVLNDAAETEMQATERAAPSEPARQPAPATTAPAAVPQAPPRPAPASPPLQSAARPAPQPAAVATPHPAAARAQVAPTTTPAPVPATRQAPPAHVTLGEKEAASRPDIRPAPWAGAAQPPARPAAPSDATRSDADTLSPLRHELADLREWMQGQIANLGDMGPMTPLGDRLQALGFSSGRARQMGAQALNLRGALADFLGRGLQVAADPVSTDGVYALVGPTGAGKTTTIAKLAARLVLQHGTAAVALITTDTYRIGGVEQLKIYGRILGVPVAVARDAEELNQHLGAFADRRFVLIDSIGLSPRDARLAEQMQWLQALGEGVTRLLVVNAGLAPGAYADLWSLYRRLPVSGAILTKLDETPAFGAALQWLVESSVPLWFYTDGQRVPEDLHVPTLAKITALLEQDPVTRFDSDAALAAGATSSNSRL